jgi:hypothetical protein
LQGGRRLAGGIAGPKHRSVTERADAQRWADAESIVDGEPSEFAVAQLRRYRRRLRLLLWSLAGFALLTIGGLVVFIALGPHHHSAAAHSRVPVWQEVVGLSTQGAGLVVLAIGFVGHVRSGGWSAAWRSPALVLTRAQRRELSAQIRGRAPIEPDRVRIARHVTELAAGPRTRRFNTCLLIGLVLEVSGQLIATPSIFRVVYTGVALVGYAIAVVVVVGRQRQMRAFLKQTRSLA